MPENNDGVTRSHSWGYSEGYSDGSISRTRTRTMSWREDETPDRLVRELEEDVAFLQRALSKAPHQGFTDGDGV